MRKEDFLNRLKEKNQIPEDKVFPVPGILPEKPVLPRKSLGDIGLEIEVEGRNLPNEIRYRSPEGNYWVVHNDGSLRGGLEYVLAAPCSESDLAPLLSALDAHFKENNCRIVLSNRTSTHVHVNVQGMKLNSLTSYFLLWTIFEKAFIKWCGEGRTSNHFCLSNSDCCNYLGRSWVDGLKKGKFGTGQEHRYSALNLNALVKFGSFEFRPLDGFKTVGRVLDWTKLLYALKKEALERLSSPSYLINLISEQRPSDFLRDLFDHNNLSVNMLEEIFSNYEDIHAFDRECIESFRDVQEICYLVDWENWKKDFEKEFYENPFSPKKTSVRSPRLRLDPLLHGEPFRVEN